MSRGIRVTVTDLETDESESVEVHDDYFLICAGSCYLDGYQAYATGTHVLTIKGRRNGATKTIEQQRAERGS